MISFFKQKGFKDLKIITGKKHNFLKSNFLNNEKNDIQKRVLSNFCLKALQNKESSLFIKNNKKHEKTNWLINNLADRVLETLRVLKNKEILRKKAVFLVGFQNFVENKFQIENRPKNRGFKVEFPVKTGLTALKKLNENY